MCAFQIYIKVAETSIKHCILYNRISCCKLPETFLSPMQTGIEPTTL